MSLGWLREGGTERVQSIIEKLWNSLTGFGGEIHNDDDHFSLELQSGIALCRSSDDSSRDISTAPHLGYFWNCRRFLASAQDVVCINTSSHSIRRCI